MFHISVKLVVSATIKQLSDNSLMKRRATIYSVATGLRMSPCPSGTRPQWRDRVWDRSFPLPDNLQQYSTREEEELQDCRPNYSSKQWLPTQKHRKTEITNTNTSPSSDGMSSTWCFVDLFHFETD